MRLALGNFVIIRATGIKDFEEMPIYARVGMHLLFYGPVQVSLALSHLLSLPARQMKKTK
jgi:hypothetical protein